MSSVRSVVHALSIIQLLAERAPLSLSEVARALDLSPSSCLALLRTLVEEGVIRREHQAKRYALADEWAAAGIPRLDPAARMTERLKSVLPRLAAEFKATVGLWAIMPGERQGLVAHVEADTPMRIHMAPGQRQPIGGGAVGRAFLAASGADPAELARRQAAIRWHRPQSAEAYAADVARAREVGYAVDDGVVYAGICSIAAVLPVGEGRFCISLSVFSGALSSEEVEATGERLKARCDALAPPNLHMC